MKAAWLLLLLWCAAPEARQVWDFKVLLDDQPIGTHRFELATAGDASTMTIEAAFAVKVLGLTVYEYRHRAQEQWRGDCLRSLQSTTNDDGDSLSVSKSADDLPSCAMSFAYWNPRMLRQSQLINAQTGNLERVTVTALGQERIEVRGRETPAVRWRITGLPSPIDLWYAPPTEPDKPAGEWLALESRTGNRLLRYQLQ